MLVDSAGTGDWHLGERMHRGSRRQLARNGYDGESHRARQFDPSWLPNATSSSPWTPPTSATCAPWPPAEDQDRIRLFGEIAGLDGQDVPDPYYGSAADFAHVLALLETGMGRLTAQLREQIQTPDPERGCLPPSRTRPASLDKKLLVRGNPDPIELYRGNPDP